MLFRSKGLFLNEESLKEVDNYLKELPLKYGLPLLNYLNAKIAEQVKGVREEAKSEE